MAIVSLRDVSYSYGAGMVIENASLSIEPGERVCLIGRNGVGKSTLMKLMCDMIEGYDGQIIWQQSARRAMLGQVVPGQTQGTVYDKVTSGLGEQGRLMRDYHHLSEQLASSGEEKLLTRLGRLHDEMDAKEVWSSHQLVETVIGKMELQADWEFAGLSAGWKRRVMLAQALVSQPDVLMLDEPTNHLDIEVIDWLENFLEGYKGTLIFVTHDRRFMEKLATRLLEIDRGRVRSWECDYRTYVSRKAAQLEAEEKQNAEFDKKLAAEEVWIRQGVKERRTRNEGRVRALKKMREQRQQRKQLAGSVKMQAQQAEASGKIVMKAQNLSFAYDTMTQPLIDNLNTTIMRGDRIGVIGPNGSGKTTLLKLLLQEYQGQSGAVEHGERIEVAYFDQLHAELDEEKSVFDNVADGNDKVVIDGVVRPVVGYLQDFLFLPERSRQPVSRLSGGERNRLLLAKMFTKPSNVLVLDEPTNDLDTDTLELLEEVLMNYRGTILMVSHDRAFLDDVVTSLLILEGAGRVREFVGGYSDWTRVKQKDDQEKQQTLQAQAQAAKQQRQAQRAQAKAVTRRLTYKEKQELEKLPQQIETTDAAIEQLHAQMAAEDFYKLPPKEMAQLQQDLTLRQSELETLYARWEELESLADQS